MVTLRLPLLVIRGDNRVMVVTNMSKSDEKWLDTHYLQEIEDERVCHDLEGWEDRPTTTFHAHTAAPWAEGEVTDADRAVAAAIRDRVKRLRG